MFCVDPQLEDMLESVSSQSSSSLLHFGETYRPIAFFHSPIEPSKEYNLLKLSHLHLVDLHSCHHGGVLVFLPPTKCPHARSYVWVSTLSRVLRCRTCPSCCACLSCHKHLLCRVYLSSHVCPSCPACLSCHARYPRYVGLLPFLPLLTRSPRVLPHAWGPTLAWVSCHMCLPHHPLLSCHMCPLCHACPLCHTHPPCHACRARCSCHARLPCHLHLSCHVCWPCCERPLPHVGSLCHHLLRDILPPLESSTSSLGGL